MSDDIKLLINVYDLRKSVFLDAMFEIKKHPFYWLHECDIHNLASFINGWIVGRRDDDAEKILSGFDEFISSKYGEGNSTIGWCSAISKRCSKEESLDKFYALFEEFLRRVNKGTHKE